MKKSFIILSCFILLKFLLSYLLAGTDYDLQRDEYLHLDQGKHLAWGYISVPPFTSWISYIINALGAGYFWVRFFPALFGALTMLLVWKTVELLQGGLFAKVCATLAILFSVLLRINILYQPNSFDVFFWTLLYYCMLRFIATRQIRWIYFWGIAAGFGILAKYNVLFLLLSLPPAFMLTRQRSIFLQKHLYAAVAITIIIVLPNFLWQVTNHYPTLTQLKELQQQQLVNVQASVFIREQLLFFANAVFIILAAFIAFVVYKPFAPYRFVGWSYLFAIALFLIFHAKPYYAIGLYPVLMAFGATWLEHLLRRPAGKWLRPALLIFIIAAAYPLLRIAFPYLSPQEIKAHPALYQKFGMLRWEDGKDHDLPQDFADMRGWRQLAAITDSACALVPMGNTIVIAENYGEAGAINYYSALINMAAVSFNADYINWFPLQTPIRNIVLVKEPYSETPQELGLHRHFDTVIVVGSVTDEFAREKAATVYLLKDARIDVNALLAKKLAKRREEYIRRR